jgi:hypothetical protein
MITNAEKISNPLQEFQMLTKLSSLINTSRAT